MTVCYDIVPGDISRHTPWLETRPEPHTTHISQYEMLFIIW